MTRASPNSFSDERETLESAESPRSPPSLLSLSARVATKQLKFLAAIGYGLISIVTMLLSKAILTEFGFKSFMCLAFMQYLTTAVICYIQSWLRGSPFPMRCIIRILFVDIFPLPMLFVLNTLSGLGATQSLNMPLFVLLRRLSIVMILFGETVFLRYSHDWETRCAVALMLLGAYWATSFSASLPMEGVVFVLVNDLCTALHSVLTRWKMDVSSISAEGIMFYSNTFAALFSGILICSGVRGELKALWAFDNWSVCFVFLLICNALSGFGITYLTYLCMKLNSPLTVAMIGATKNVFTSYAGMLFSDYTYTWSSFVGVNISLLGCVLYSHREIVRILHQRDSQEKQRVLAKKENPNQ